MWEEKGYGKINLGLAITGRCTNGYHTINTVFQSIGLADIIQFTEASTFRLTCTHQVLPCDESNLAYKAYQLLRTYAKNKTPLHIHIKKNIPMAAGLAGGSADGAAVLRGLNQIWELHLSVDELCQLGETLGADVPFCIHGGTMHGMGKGEILKKLPSLPPWHVVLLHPDVAVQTKEAYALFDQRQQVELVPMQEIIQCVYEKNMIRLVSIWKNTFEELVLPEKPLIQKCKALFSAFGIPSLMSGSGSAVFALISSDVDEKQLQMLAKEAHHQGIAYYRTTLIG